MKRKLWLNHLLGAFFAFLFSLSAVGGLVTGFHLNVTSIGRLFFWCGLFSVLSALLLYFKYGGWGILLLSVRGAFALWQDGALWEQVQSLAHTISTHYRNVYNWRAIGTPLSEEFDLALILLAYLTTVSVSFCICRRKHIIIALPPVILPMVLCLITTDTLPDERYLYLLMLGIVLLLVTDWARRSNPRQFAGLTLRTVIPAAAALALLFTLNPQEEYVNHAAEFQKEAVVWFQQLKSTAEAAASGNITGNFAVQKLNLRNVGPKSKFSYSVMRITASYDGTVYLRGRDYDIYTGTMWESSAERGEMLSSASSASGTLSIVTYGVRNVLYTPYYVTDAIELIGGFAENSENTKSYSYSVSQLPDVHRGNGIAVSGYTDLPAETYAWANTLLKNILSEKTSGSVVQVIADYVRNSASYDRSTSVMNSDCNDFARWFLEESDTGYCVHFATAAAVLLRAAGIPARYVEGYMVSCQANEKILVSNQEAHAWVEYYDSESSVWRVLEATPADAIPTEEGIPAETEAIESEDTEPAETQAEEVSPDQPENTENTQQGITDENTGDTVGDGAEGSSGGSSGNSNNTGRNSGSTGEPAQRKMSFRIPDWVKTLAWIILVLAAIPVQGNLRIACKRKQWNTGISNEMALVRWKQSRRLVRLTKAKMPQELEELALKAKFSQHTITREELDRFDLFRQKILQAVDHMPWYRKYFLRWIFAVG